MNPKIRYAWGLSSLGDFIAASSAHGLVAVEFAERGPVLPIALHERFAQADMVEDAAGMAATVRALASLIERPQTGSELAIDMHGTEFQRQVWHALRGIPAGQTASYGMLAASLGQPKAAREVAQACAANTLAVLIPCHRIIKKDGSISGYRWGVRRKRALLEREARA